MTNSQDSIDFKALIDRRLANLPIKLDAWQEKVMQHEGSITIRSGRQVGKSTIIALKAVKFACEHPKTRTLIISASQRQSSLLYEKVRGELDYINEEVLESKWQALEQKERNYHGSATWKKREWDLINGIYSEPPTQTKLSIKNGSRVYSLPAGRTGYFIRGFTLDLMIADEAAYIPEQVWIAVKPMIAVSRKTRGLGYEILLSTPFGKAGYFFQSFTDSDFKQFHISSEDCERIPKSFLNKEKLRLTKTEYAQEYLGEFIDEFNQFFPSVLIKQRMTFIGWEYKAQYRKSCDYFLGVDIARYGGDENAFVIAEMDSLKHVRIVKAETTMRKSLTDTSAMIIKLDETYNFNRIFIDDAGIGAGVYDILTDHLGRKKVIEMNNSKKTEEKDGRTGRIFKEDMYSNALALMERGGIDIISSLKLERSLKCMTFEYTLEKTLRISGSYSHLAEAFVRACWCVKAKNLNLFIY